MAKALLVTLIFWVPIFAQALSCEFEAKHRFVGTNYFGFRALDGDRQTNQHWYYSQVKMSEEKSSDWACLGAVDELRIYDIEGFCSPDWHAVRSTINTAFSIPYTQPMVEKCLKRVDEILRSKTTAAEVTAIRQKLLSSVGEKVLATMSDEEALTTAKKLNLK